MMFKTRRPPELAVSMGSDRLRSHICAQLKRRGGPVNTTTPNTECGRDLRHRATVFEKPHRFVRL
jgi:hypothetical protein